jgi:hypothetical protein
MKGTVGGVEGGSVGAGVVGGSVGAGVVGGSVGAGVVGGSNEVVVAATVVVVVSGIVVVSGTVVVVVSGIVVVSGTVVVVVVSGTVVVVSMTVVGGSVTVVGGSVVVGAVVAVVVVVGFGGFVVGGLVGPVDVPGAEVPGCGLFCTTGAGVLVTGGGGVSVMVVAPLATTPASAARVFGDTLGREPLGLPAGTVVVLATPAAEKVKGAKTGATRLRVRSFVGASVVEVGPTVSSVLTFTPSFLLLGSDSPRMPAPNSAAAAPKAQRTRLRWPPSSPSTGGGVGSDSGGSKMGPFGPPPSAGPPVIAAPPALLRIVLPWSSPAPSRSRRA